jgi:MoxR-like ATPase
VEYEGTYPLPEAQLDRFLTRVSFGYPTVEEESDVLLRRMRRQQEEITLDPVTDAEGLLAMQAAVEQITVEDSVVDYCVRLATATRDHAQVLIGASPRGSLALLLVGRALAVVRGRDFVTPEDVKAVAQAVLTHRVTIKPELWMSGVTATSVVHGLLGSVPAPATAKG